MPVTLTPDSVGDRIRANQTQSRNAVLSRRADHQ